MSRREEMLEGYRLAFQNAREWGDLARTAKGQRRDKYEEHETDAYERAKWYLERANDK